MPNVGVHLLLADRVLQWWSEAGADPPFQPDDPLARSCFFHGAILPDAGYFPRGDRLFSELAHLCRTGDLLRALVAEAGTPLQRATAWGWVTHVLADLAIHPSINEAHGEHLYGSRARAVTSTEDESGHMRLEYGLDAAVFGLDPRLTELAPRSAPPPEAMGHIQTAYGRVYGWSPSTNRLLADHRTTRQVARLSGFVARLHLLKLSRARRPTGDAGSAVAHGSDAAPRFRWRRSSIARALLDPLAPPDWLVATVSEAAGSFPEMIDRIRSGQLAQLPDHDLISGELGGPGAGSPRRMAAEEALAARRSADGSSG